MTTQYVMANIQIPIEILQDESFELMPEYISIQIENCHQLPEKKNLTHVQNTLLEQIKDAIEKKRQRGELVQLPSERPNKKRPQNVTFKRSRQGGSRYTIRQYDSDDSDSDSSGPIETGSGSDEGGEDGEDDDEEDDGNSSESESDEEDKENKDDEISNTLSNEKDRQQSNPFNGKDRQQSNPFNEKDRVSDSSQLQEVQELEPVDGLSHLNLKEDEYQE